MRLIRGHWPAFREIFGLLTRHRELMFELARRDVSDRYAGQALGLFWAVAHPLFMMAVYVFIFAFVFKAKVGGSLEMPLDYTAYILAGLIPWLTFQEAMNKSCTAITANSGLVKQVVFPIEVLPAKGVVSSVLPQLVSTSILVVYVLATSRHLPTTYLLLPVLLFLQLMAMMGVAYLLSAIGTYFRDVKEFVQLFGTVGMYAMPVFYLPGWVPEIFKPILYANPFSYLTWCYQDALYFGRIDHPWAWVVNVVLSILIFILGYRVFRKLKPGFGNAL
ncbi:ABC transporter permease [Polaromonas sp.]|uniref:ABC transporter permease n=1 Tax=Polaromonas sp. TaxID=1869339 RepID=UPI003BAA31FD